MIIYEPFYVYFEFRGSLQLFSLQLGVDLSKFEHTVVKTSPSLAKYGDLQSQFVTTKKHHLDFQQDLRSHFATATKKGV